MTKNFWNDINTNLYVLYINGHCQIMKSLIAKWSLLNKILFDYSEEIVGSYYAKRLLLETSVAIVIFFLFDAIY